MGQTQGGPHSLVWERGSWREAWCAVRVVGDATIPPRNITVAEPRGGSIPLAAACRTKSPPQQQQQQMEGNPPAANQQQ